MLPEPEPLWLQVEQLLETYFMNLDNTYNQLQTLGEYIKDTEDYIQFDLDTKRNKFIEVCSRLCSLGFRTVGICIANQRTPFSPAASSHGRGPLARRQADVYCTSGVGSLAAYNGVRDIRVACL